MKEFYGKVSFTGRASFGVKAENKKSAKDIIFEDIEGIEILLKDGTTVEISEIEWDLINERKEGLVHQPYVNDFEICEENQ